jgi:dienelactone hydrolase
MSRTLLLLPCILLSWSLIRENRLNAQGAQPTSANSQNSPEIHFRPHLLNSESEFSAAGLIDVNSDGRLDIVCGAWWYESPSWTKHYFREVEKIRGRFDDYSNLAIDVDGDSFQDIVSVNYRSQSLYWCRNPGKQSPAPAGEASHSLWSTKVIDRPGTSETGRLADIDGDGQLDVLPSGTNFAAWYEFKRGKDGEVTWIKHNLPDELIGHGVGVGDLNGDGRVDIVGTKGWAEGPVDARNDRWVWHSEFELAKDCGLPILCWDVDEDGDTDLVWGRGHNIGLYWTEQVDSAIGSVKFVGESGALDQTVQNAMSTKKWITHAIDTSWSSVHTLMTADIDGDGRDELVTGKRYLAHDGKDPGEYDPLAVYWYDFDKAQRTWKRTTVSVGGSCGIDLDSACSDLDGDGDIDIVAPTRNGLHWLENLRIDHSAKNKPVDSSGSDSSIGNPKYEEHLDLSYFLKPDGSRQKIETPFHHGIRRQHVLSQMQEVMGSLPSSQARIPLGTEVQSVERLDNYWRIHLTYVADRYMDKEDRVPAFLLIPHEISKPAQAMLCLHQTHFQLGKGEPCGLGGSANLHIAHELAQRGFVCLAPDYPGFSEYSYSFEDHAQQYASGTMKGIWNHIRAVDLLETLPCVKRDSIGVIGHSLGGHNALFVAAFDQRLRCAVTSCGFNAFEDYYGGNLKGWTSSRYMPRIATQYASSPKQVPFDFPEVLAAIAPRPIFVNAPRDDANFALVGVEKCETAVRPLYSDILKASDRMIFEYPDVQHDFPTDVRFRAYDWLKANLK